ncbi:hypothetical protein M413DRAFT_350880 [Hebeloma cylindrosporum]|uniref:Protein kinase domain-containing protein n=1 Tax=Hebeloma cylindrosporum TaxID=76867 RepID=A0A0C3BEZ2_HEBCY|nr:hypothetical protein M413DRAFT_350880 [Hebeloma cylindrosporum h7]
MAYGGDSLVSRQAESRRVSFTEQDRLAITNALRSLHDRGIRHGDIRMENLILYCSGSVYIIDFDQAHVDSGKNQLKVEMDGLADLLASGDEEKGNENNEDENNDDVGGDNGGDPP